MRTLPLKNTNSFVVISDTHLRSPHDDTSTLFVKTLMALENIDAVFLLGDIFDFFAATPFFFRMWENVFSSFRFLKNKGIRVYFIEGNHDFGFEHFKNPFLTSCLTDYGDMVVEVEHPKVGKIILRHGDDIVCPKSYVKFRRLVKSKFLQRLATLFLPGILLHLVFSVYAKMSRGQYKPLSENFLNSCMSDYLSSCKITPNVVIIGHIHTLVDTHIHQTRLLAGQDWFLEPSYLELDENGTFKRILLRETQHVLH